MGLDKFKDKNRDELSMIEVARAILEDNGKRMAFAILLMPYKNTWTRVTKKFVNVCHNSILT